MLIQRFVTVWPPSLSLCLLLDACGICISVYRELRKGQNDEKLNIEPLENRCCNCKQMDLYSYREANAKKNYIIVKNREKRAAFRRNFLKTERY